VKALVLSGGAARGAYEAGVVCALLERERFDIVCGTSIGALNGFLAATEEPDKLRRLWHTAASRRLLRLSVGDVARMQAVFSHEPVRGLIREHGALHELKHTYIVAVTNLTRGAPEAFYLFRGSSAHQQAAFLRAEPDARPLTADNFIEALLAATAIPPAFVPVDISVGSGSTHRFADAAIANNSPLRQAIDAGADDVTLIYLEHSDVRYRNHRARNVVEIAALAQDIVSHRILELDLKLARAVNEAVRAGGYPGKRVVKIRTIGPSEPLHIGHLQFSDQKAIDHAFDQGYGDGRRTVEDKASIDHAISSSV
jgi:predicted acylesterase/phospholipase RssA